MTDEKIEYSIVIPAYNEEFRLALTLERIVRYFETMAASYEIIVVDDGSNDRTEEIAVKSLHGVRHQILRNPRNRGKGYSVRKGVLAASGDTILFTDSDLSTPIEEFEKLNSVLRDGFDIAIGSRSIESSNVEIHQNIIRETMGKVFNLVARAVSFREINDSQCGFKAFTRQAGKRVFERQRLNGFCFDAEILFLAQKMNYRIKEVGVRWRNSSQSKVRIFEDSLMMLVDLCRIRILHHNDVY